MHKKDKHKEIKEEINEQTENPFVEETPVVAPSNEMIAQYAKLEEEKKTIESQYIRLAADFDNYRKRQEQERESLLKYGAESTIQKLLPIIDTFERAKKSFVEIDDPEKLRESFDAVQKQFIDALEKLGVEKIKTDGEEFDPNLHEAVMQSPSEEHPDHTIIAELQSGYKLNEKVIRAALVNVAVNG